MPRAHKYVIDNNFAGHGVILCAACNEPLRDHPLTRRCEHMGEGRMTAPPRHSRRGEPGLTNRPPPSEHGLRAG